MLSSFEKLRNSLSRTKENILGQLSRIVLRRKIDDDLLDEIEQILVEADVGIKATTRLIDSLREKSKQSAITEGSEVMALLREEITAILTPHNPNLFAPEAPRPIIWLITGVNGVGKTTTIGKLATKFSADGLKVLIGACDTFRAAAIDQIQIWADRSKVEIIRAQEGADPSSVAFDAAAAASARGVDILLLDTAGRLHTKSNLMDELQKIRRVVQKAAPDATIQSRLVIDGNTGQNALSQVRLFAGAVGCDGLIITKLDGTAKGGVVIAIAEELGVPVDFIGIGEGIDDLQRFDSEQFVEALFA